MGSHAKDMGGAVQSDSTLATLLLRNLLSFADLFPKLQNLQKQAHDKVLLFPTGYHQVLYAANNSGSGTARCRGRPQAVEHAHLPPLLQPRASRPAVGTAAPLPFQQGSSSHWALSPTQVCSLLTSLSDSEGKIESAHES